MNNRTSSNIKAILAAGIAALGCAAFAQAMPQKGEEEVHKLISSIEQSSCQFERNGTWYNAAEAATHLRRKFDATEKRLQTAEQFVQYVASSSSITKKPYQIRCGAETVRAKVWLDRKLSEFRKK